ncbi:MAG: succinyldiaminopimelate transaminase [Leptospirillia bacterium]
MNPDLKKLPAYPFERLRHLLEGVTPPDLPHISMGIGEPRRAAPAVFLEALAKASADFSRYPTTQGSAELRAAIAEWLSRRFHLPEVNPDTQVVPCSGTREALFSIAQAAVGAKGKDRVLVPNPFYQIYKGAALWSGATPTYVPALAENNFLPDYAGLPAEVLDRTAMLYLCTPANPTGAVATMGYMERLIELAERHDFLIVSDECYSEIYPDEAMPPPGILEAAHRSGNTGFSRCLAFHSLSKRSNLPGARSGFVAGDAERLAAYLRLRTYTGCTIPLPIQTASAATWRDEAHVAAGRADYRENFRVVGDILSPVLPLHVPDAGFYLWLEVPDGGEAFSRKVFERCNMTVLPGAYLAQTVDGENPADRYVRMALVDTPARCAEAARRILDVL